MQNVRHPKTHRDCVNWPAVFSATTALRWCSVTAFTYEHPDALGFRNGASCLIEVKCSRSDFLAARKRVWEAGVFISASRV